MVNGELHPLNAETAAAVTAALELKRQSMSRFFERRQVEWRVALALWGAMAVVANAGRDLSLTCAPKVLVWVGVVGLAALHAVWEVAYHRRAAKPNRAQGIDLDGRIRTILGLDPPQPQVYLAWVAHGWQPTVTLLLGLASALVIASG